MFFTNTLTRLLWGFRATREAAASQLIIPVLLLIAMGSLAQQPPVVPNSSSPDAQYVLGPDSQPRAGVPEGRILEFVMKDSKVFPGFEHAWWLYIPKQYEGKKPVALMVF